MPARSGGGQAIWSLSELARGRLRNRALGFVYQFHHLLPEFSALENVAMPLLIRRQQRASALAEAGKCCRKWVSGTACSTVPANSPAANASVRHRRALVTQPACVLMDEPTGNLDRHSAGRIQDLLMALSRSHGTAFLIVTTTRPGARLGGCCA